MLTARRSAIAGGLVALLAAFPARGGDNAVLAVADEAARQPQVAVDAEGRVFVAYGAGNRVFCVASDDGGQTFGSPVEVGSVGALSLGMRRGPRIAAAGSSVIVAAIGGRTGKGRDGDVLAWRSADAGRTWTGPDRLNAEEGSAREGLHALAAGPDGRVFCAWLDLRHDRSEIVGARSRDGGATWEPDRLVYQAPEKSVCPCCHPSAAFGPDGTLYVMWRNDVRGARDMYLSRSSDGGQTFTAAEKLGNGTWKLNLCPMDGGAVAAGPNGRVETVWMRSASMFAATPGRRERPLGPGVQGWAALGSEGAPYVVWLDRRPGRLLAKVPGRDEPIVLTDRANDPVVASPLSGDGPVIAAWEAPGGITTTRLDILTTDRSHP